jgi:folate-binding protein YgfZ
VEQWRILHGVPRYGQDIREKDLPQETEQTQALNFSKGCYIGQEIVERIRSRGQVHRKFTGFEFQNGLPEPGKVEAEGRVVAEITSVAEVAGKNLGLGYVRRETGMPGSAIDLNGKAATVADLPFRIHRN